MNLNDDNFESLNIKNNWIYFYHTFNKRSISILEKIEKAGIKQNIFFVNLEYSPRIRKKFEIKDTPFLIFVDRNYKISDYLNNFEDEVMEDILLLFKNKNKNKLYNFLNIFKGRKWLKKS